MVHRQDTCDGCGAAKGFWCAAVAGRSCHMSWLNQLKSMNQNGFIFPKIEVVLKPSRKNHLKGWIQHSFAPSMNPMKILISRKSLGSASIERRPLFSYLKHYTLNHAHIGHFHPNIKHGTQKVMEGKHVLDRVPTLN